MSATSRRACEDVEHSLAVLRLTCAKLPPEAPAALAVRLAIARTKQSYSQMGGLIGC
jgi:hypothetical protein